MNTGIGPDWDTSKAIVKARHINVLHGTKGSVRNRRLKVHAMNRRRSVLIVTHVCGVDSGRLRTDSDVGDWRWGEWVWACVDEGSRMRVRMKLRGGELLLLRGRRDETSWHLLREALSRVGTDMPLRLCVRA